MNKYICATIWKELLIVKKHIKTSYIFLIMGYVIIMFISIVKIKVQMNEMIISLPSIEKIILYIIVYVGFLNFVNVMRFWEEKNLGTMEILFIINQSIRVTIVSKVISYIIVQVVNIVIFYNITSVIFSIYFGQNLFSLKTLLLGILLSIVLTFPYGIINGYVMWCMKTGIAKIMQVISTILSLGCLGVLWGKLDQTYISRSFIIFLSCTIITLWIIAGLSLIKSNKEKALLNMPD